ncbi:hypothetical protein [Nocardioides convexus]|uniref:hypothetical protein n=1 Tax=Nocardioides convexus TaxID=2712224 RepID=UPI002418BBE2|nr:hypothetical protein [Nocardioides convexus]
MTTPPQKPSPFGIYRPEYVDRSAVEHTVVHHDGTREVIADPTEFASAEELDGDLGKRPSPYPAPADTITRRMPLGTFVHARSGDKGGNANLGLWVKNDGSDKYEARVQWLAKIVKDRKIREPGARGEGPRHRRLRAAEPRRRQRRDPRLARRRCRRVHPVRPAGQGPGRVGPQPHRPHPGGLGMTRTSTTAGPRSSAPSSSPPSPSPSAR